MWTNQRSSCHGTLPHPLTTTSRQYVVVLTCQEPLYVLSSPQKCARSKYLECFFLEEVRTITVYLYMLCRCLVFLICPLPSPPCKRSNSEAVRGGVQINHKNRCNLLTRINKLQKKKDLSCLEVFYVIVSGLNFLTSSMAHLVEHQRILLHCRRKMEQ